MFFYSGKIKRKRSKGKNLVKMLFILALSLQLTLVWNDDKSRNERLSCNQRCDACSCQPQIGYNFMNRILINAPTTNQHNVASNYNSLQSALTLSHIESHKILFFFKLKWNILKRREFFQDFWKVIIFVSLNLYTHLTAILPQSKITFLFSSVISLLFSFNS